MKFIPIGLQCSVPNAIASVNLREYSYPFDWLWSPSKTTYEILNILLNSSTDVTESGREPPNKGGVDEAVIYMTTGYSYYKYVGNERYASTDIITSEQINKHTGLGNTHFIIDDEYKSKLKRRLERLLQDIKSDNHLVLIYADSAGKDAEYMIDGVIYSEDPREYLKKIYDLVRHHNPCIELLYFCWDQRIGTDDSITYIPFSSIKNWYIRDWNGVSVLIQQYLEENTDKYFI